MSADVQTMFDLIVVGAGIYGIAGANTYRSIHPAANICILESEPDVGGIWSKARDYPGFRSQSGSRVVGFPDLPFRLRKDEDVYMSLCEARTIGKYLEEYVTVRGLRGRCMFDTSVTSITYTEDASWAVRIATKGALETTLHAKKVMIATGMFTQPNIPVFANQESFKGPRVHQKHWGRSSILSATEADVEKHKRITIIGGSKSAADAVFVAAADKIHPRTVNWIIRNSGAGPLDLIVGRSLGKYHHLTELGSARIMNALSTANPWLEENWWDWFAHKTAVGDWLLDKVWNSAKSDAVAKAKYDERDNGVNGFAGLKSDGSARWRNGSVGALSRDADEFWDTIAQGVTVHRSDIESLQAGAVRLANGVDIPSDVILLATGFTQSHPYFSARTAAWLGLPTSPDAFSSEETERWAAFDVEADRAVLKRWPYFLNSPGLLNTPIDGIQTTPYRLHNLTSTPATNSIVFLGLPIVPNSFHTAIVQSLYACSILDGHLFNAPEGWEEKTAFVTAWCKRKYPKDGQQGNAMEFEMTSFTDHLLGELGLRSHLDGMEGWWKWLMEPLWAEQYGGLIGEYKAKYEHDPSVQA